MVWGRLERLWAGFFFFVQKGEREVEEEKRETKREEGREDNFAF